MYLYLAIVFVVVMFGIAYMSSPSKKPKRMRTRYIVHLESEQSRARKALQSGDLGALEQMPQIVADADGVTVIRGNKRVEYFIRKGQVWSARNGSGGRSIEDQSVLCEVMVKLGLADAIEETIP